MPKTLTDHEEIRQWAIARGGNPMLMETPDVNDTRTHLQITFGQHALNADANEGPDRAVGGYRLVSWQEWFDALEESGLAIRVNDDPASAQGDDFEFVARNEADRVTTDAAQKPAAGPMSGTGGDTDYREG
ncbi:hypothetical protein GCM10007989_19900 [Devosia pacifica]|uniref:Uncharacterized protein n=1 Tax=Devosia pacifica TaxID=1335967 RepID=A0A918S4L9_9HYPH|nr:hypothetical protein [Devosia pacifica]GHA24254.1 hypothetical protein GCM10007989_19900 [Devosia pacifica]